VLDKVWGCGLDPSTLGRDHSNGSSGFATCEEFFDCETVSLSSRLCSTKLPSPNEENARQLPRPAPVYRVESQPTFRRNILLPSLGSKNNPGKKKAWSRQQVPLSRGYIAQYPRRQNFSFMTTFMRPSNPTCLLPRSQLIHWSWISPYMKSRIVKINQFYLPPASPFVETGIYLRVHKSLTLDPTLSWLINFDVIFPSKTESLKWSLQFRFCDWIFAWISKHLYTCFKARPFYSSWLDTKVYNCYKYIYWHMFINIRISKIFFQGSIYLRLYSPLLDLGRFLFSWSFTQPVGLLERGISPSQGRYLHTQDSTNTE
jgi:hypothetical protein